MVPAGVFTEEEQSLILHYLGYPKDSAEVAATSLGYRMVNNSLQYLQTTFLRLAPEGVERVREGLRELKCIDQELSKLRSRAAVKKTGDAELDVPGARRMLLAERRRYITLLSNDLAAPINPSANGSGPRVVNT
jgi:hypothetical protein